MTDGGSYYVENYKSTDVPRENVFNIPKRHQFHINVASHTYTRTHTLACICTFIHMHTHTILVELLVVSAILILCWDCIDHLHYYIVKRYLNLQTQLKMSTIFLIDNHLSIIFSHYSNPIHHNVSFISITGFSYIDVFLGFIGFPYIQ